MHMKSYYHYNWNIKVLLMFFLLTAPLLCVAQGYVHKGSFTGTGEDLYIVNTNPGESISDVGLKLLHRTKSGYKAWAMFSKASESNLRFSFGDWDDFEGTEKHTGDSRMMLHRTRGLLTLNPDGYGLTPSFLAKPSTHGYYVKAGRDNAFFGLRKRTKDEYSSYDAVVYWGNNSDDNLYKFRF